MRFFALCIAIQTRIIQYDWSGKASEDESAGKSGWSAPYNEEIRGERTHL